MMHTPGPWRWEPDVDDEDRENRVYLQPDVLDIYESHGGGRVPSTEDAQLIAAAPEMYDALKAFMAKWADVLPHINGAFVMGAIHGHEYSGPTLDVELQQIAAAIAKAEGRG